MRYVLKKTSKKAENSRHYRNSENQVVINILESVM